MELRACRPIKTEEEKLHLESWLRSARRPAGNISYIRKLNSKTKRRRNLQFPCIEGVDGRIKSGHGD
jgi:hypothetical protein